jgi:hypothetical protein
MFKPANVLSTEDSAFLISRSKSGKPILYVSVRAVHHMLDSVGADYSELLEAERDALAEYYTYCNKEE